MKTRIFLTILTLTLSICAYSQTLDSFSYTGALTQLFTVPAEVHSICTEVKGGDGSRESSGSNLTLGGQGALVKACFCVTPGRPGARRCGRTGCTC